MTNVLLFPPRRPSRGDTYGRCPVKGCSGVVVVEWYPPTDPPNGHVGPGYGACAECETLVYV